MPNLVGHVSGGARTLWCAAEQDLQIVGSAGASMWADDGHRHALDTIGCAFEGVAR